MAEAKGKGEIKQKTVVAQVMEKIRAMISSGEYKAGDKIPTEIELAQRFGIGRSSIREALKVFNYLGILESKAALGTFVSDGTKISSEALSWAVLLGKKELLEMVELRGSLEAWALFKLVQDAAGQPELIQKLADELEAAVQSFKKAAARDSIDELIKADYSFHRILVQSCRNNIFLDQYDILRDFMYDEIRAAFILNDSYSYAVDGHMAIVDSIRTGDAVLMQACLRKHIKDISDHLNTFRRRQETVKSL